MAFERGICAQCGVKLMVKPTIGQYNDEYYPCHNCLPVTASSLMIEEFRLLGLNEHRHHPGEWEDCHYTFCKRRHRLWLAARTGEVAAVVSPGESVPIAEALRRAHEEGYKKGVAHGFDNGKRSIELAFFAEVVLEQRAEAHMRPRERCRYSASVLPMTQCALDEGHQGDHTAIRG